VRESYGSLEKNTQGPYVRSDGRLSLIASGLLFGWLVVWRGAPRRFTEGTRSTPRCAGCDFSWDEAG